jgi:mono/diheme cytochrome c family protein
VAACACVTACGWDFNRMNEQPRCEPLARRPWLPDQRCDQRAPDGSVPWHAPAGAPPEPAATRELITRGADRFARMCAPCHGTLGDGQSEIARDMRLRPPPSLLSKDVSAYPDQRIFEIITSGYGMMPAYDYQLEPADRWAVVHYVRVLERSQAVALDSLTPQQRAEAQRWLK